MAKVIGGMTISIDGFVADDKGDSGALYGDLAALGGTAYMTEMVAETGAVVMGRRSFEMADDPGLACRQLRVPDTDLRGRQPPAGRHPTETDALTFTFVTDGPEAAVRQARAAAGDRAVQIVGGAKPGSDLLAAGLVDELRVDIMPVFLGTGTRLIDDPASAGVRVEKVSVEEVGQRTTLRLRVLR